MSCVSSKGNILCRLINIELYKIFAIINRAIKGLHCNILDCKTQYTYLASYPGYFWEPHWKSMGLPEISRVTWQVCLKLSVHVPLRILDSVLVLGTTRCPPANMILSYTNNIIFMRRSWRKSWHRFRKTSPLSLPIDINGAPNVTPSKWPLAWAWYLCTCIVPGVKFDLTLLKTDLTSFPDREVDN